MLVTACAVVVDLGPCSGVVQEDGGKQHRAIPKLREEDDTRRSCHTGYNVLSARPVYRKPLLKFGNPRDVIATVGNDGLGI